MGSENLIGIRANWRYHVSRLPYSVQNFLATSLNRACLASGHRCKRDISRQHSTLNLGGVPVQWRNQALTRFDLWSFRAIGISRKLACSVAMFMIAASLKRSQGASRTLSQRLHSSKLRGLRVRTVDSRLFDHEKGQVRYWAERELDVEGQLPKKRNAEYIFSDYWDPTGPMRE